MAKSSRIAPVIARGLQDLIGPAANRPGLNYDVVEAALHRQMGFIDCDRPVRWAGGPREGAAYLVTAGFADFAEHAEELARTAAQLASSSLRLLRQSAVNDFVKAAEKAAAKAARARSETDIAASILDPGFTHKNQHFWSAKIAGDPSLVTLVMDAYTKSRRLWRIEKAFQKLLSEAAEPAGIDCQSSWMSGWMSHFAGMDGSFGNPSPREEADAARWDRLIEKAGDAAYLSCRQMIGALAKAAAIEHVLLVSYGAISALGLLNGWFGRDRRIAAPPWHFRYLLGYWMPFVHQFSAGLDRLWVTPDGALCLPRPKITPCGCGRWRVKWPNGESMEW